jgi:hypothetical protein
MTYITDHDRSPLLLLPEAVDDYVGLDNPVRACGKCQCLKKTVVECPSGAPILV